MKTMGIFETKNRLSEVCEQVATSREPLVITRHGKPLVRIVPLGAEGERSCVWDTVSEGRVKYGVLAEEFELPSRGVGGGGGRPDPLGV
jgi:prevent-host-death family protein